MISGFLPDHRQLCSLSSDRIGMLLCLAKSRPFSPLLALFLLLTLTVLTDRM